MKQTLKSQYPQPRLSPLNSMYFDKRLSSFFHFTEDDLEANRHGYLNAGQAKRKFRHYFSQSWIITLILVPAFLIGAIGICAMTFAFGISLVSAFAPTDIEQAIRPFSERLIISGTLGILWLYLVWVCGKALVRAILNLMDLREGIVDYSVGKISIRGGVKYNPTVLIVNRTKYRFPAPTMHKLRKQLKNDTRYVVYYLPRSRTVISIEPLDQI